MENNSEFAAGVEAYRRRKGFKSTLQAIKEITQLAGVKRADKLYRYMNGKDRPGRDKAMILAALVNRRPEKCWPPRGVE